MSNGFDDLFKGLEGFGLNDLDGVSLYSKKEEEEKKKAAVTKSSPADFVFDRKVECPVCKKNITVKAVKTSGVRTISRDTDFMTYYQDPNPMFYDAWLCTLCGYASMSGKFSAVSDKQIKLIKEKICSKWSFNKAYPPVYDADVALELHQLALLNTVVRMGRDSEKAMICLKMGWIYRIKKDNENEKKFLFQALQGLMSAFGKESFPIAGMDEGSMMYLIGELYRRIDDPQNALLWFSRVLSDRNTKPRIKELARNQKDVIREQESKEGTV